MPGSSSIAGVCSRCQIWYMLEACEESRSAALNPTRSYRQPYSHVPKFSDLTSSHQNGIG
jgi:hypothetical protein